MTADELLELCRDNLTKIKIPVAVHIVPELPKNAVGKLDKPALRARDAAELDGPSDGRQDLGLGAGYVREEFEAAELPYQPARQRGRR